MILTTSKSQQQPRRKKQTRNKEFYSGAIRLCKCKSQRQLVTYEGHMWFGPFVPFSILFLVGDATHRKYRPTLMQAIFLLVPPVLFAAW